MSEALGRLADGLVAAGRDVAALGQRLPAGSVTVPAGSPSAPTGPTDPRAFGAGAVGRLGPVGERLHAIWDGACQARAAEARDWADRVADAAVIVSRAAAGYDEAEHDAGRALPGVDR